ncbi:putative dipeptidase C3A11.10c [Daldinia childiae]|uniref:putative dipeptidase C3A11.10c n=1 Tax=Daldinia childiae TaxID=326645 RepID=UPI001446103F|nr:putative dipeptidase C3A11.10c [Daldinia childiae]KAF3058032.1 putative dipeptidase C3A11.10c [Daldinia childiae]
MPVILTLPPPKSPVWYLAYGSNLSSRKFIHDRGITPLGIAVVAVPGFTLTLDSAGVPYSEPAYASISPGECVHAEKPMPLIGTAYLVTDEMYKKVIKSEGGGIAYREVEVQALVEASTDRRVITARTIELFGQVDFPRLRKSQLGAQFWSVYVECPRTSQNYSDSIYREIIHDTLQQIDLVYRLIKEFPEYLIYAASSYDIKSQLASGSSRVSSLMGIEGLHQIGNSASILRMYHALGVRYATLTHTCHNIYADSEEPETPLHGGLSERGRQLVREMNRIGMMVDLSHTSFQTQRDTIDISLAPVVYTHSSAYAIREHSRNVPNDILLSLKQNDGLIMITFYPEFTSAQPDKASLEDVADHIEYVGNFIGYRHVGIGSDFDGMDHGPSGLEDVSKYPDLVKELLNRGVSRENLTLVTSENIVRVLEVVERVAADMSTVKPLEDDTKPFF